MANTSEQSKSNIDVDTGHDYDGIHEYDNPLPRWWLIIFWVCIAFGYGYWIHFHVAGTGKSEIAELQEQQAEAVKRAANAKEVTDDVLTLLSKDPETTAAGAKLFATNCVVCHGANGEGKIGPNLTDAFWIHGNKPTDIYKTVSTGVLEKGMPAWLPVLGPDRVRTLVAFVITREGLNLPGKEPQGVRVTGGQ